MHKYPLAYWQNCGKVQGQPAELPESSQLPLLSLKPMKWQQLEQLTRRKEIIHNNKKILFSTKWFRKSCPTLRICAFYFPVFSANAYPGGWVPSPKAASEHMCPSTPVRSSPWWSGQWWRSHHHYKFLLRSYHMPAPSHQPPEDLRHTEMILIWSSLRIGSYIENVKPYLHAGFRVSHDGEKERQDIFSVGASISKTQSEKKEEKEQDIMWLLNIQRI